MSWLISALPLLGSVFGFTLPPGLVSVLPSVIALAPAIQEAIRLGTPAVNEVLKAAPDLIPLLKKIGTSAFPDVAAQLSQVAGAQIIFDPTFGKEAQTLLNALGQSPALVVDGFIGPKTKAAVAAYQQKAGGLVVDGWPGPLTNAALRTAVGALQKKA